VSRFLIFRDFYIFVNFREFPGVVVWWGCAVLVRGGALSHTPVTRARERVRMPNVVPPKEGSEGRILPGRPFVRHTANL
jgi:hypothetical protein